MKLVKSPNNEEAMCVHCLTSENKLVEMGVYRVMYGFRVRAWFVENKFGVVLDWCGGGNWPDVERLYSLLVAILTNRPEDEQCFDGLPPISMIKPFFKDERFTQIVVKEAGENLQMISLEKPDFPDFIQMLFPK